MFFGLLQVLRQVWAHAEKMKGFLNLLLFLFRQRVQLAQNRKGKEQLTMIFPGNRLFDYPTATWVSLGTKVEWIYVRFNLQTYLFYMQCTHTHTHTHTPKTNKKTNKHKKNAKTPRRNIFHTHTKTQTMANGSLGPSGFQATSPFCFFLLFLRLPLSPSLRFFPLKYISRTEVPANSSTFNTVNSNSWIIFKAKSLSVLTKALNQSLSVSVTLWSCGWTGVCFLDICGCSALISLNSEGRSDGINNPTLPNQPTDKCEQY